MYNSMHRSTPEGRKLMRRRNPMYVSKEGGTINCYRGDTGWLFRVCSEHLCIYCTDLPSARAQLHRLEKFKRKSSQISFQAMKREGQKLRNLVETAAAPYLEEEVA